MSDWIKMRGPFGGIIQTSMGQSPVAVDGSFFIPQSDVQTFLNRGCFFAGPPLGSVQIDGYLLTVENGDFGVIDPNSVFNQLVPPAVQPGGAVVSKTSNYAIQPSDTETTFDNAGASGLVIFSLPPIVAGFRFSFIVASSFVLEILATGADRIALGTQVSGFAGVIQSNFLFSSISLIAPSGPSHLWVAQSNTGGWNLL